MIYKQCVLTIAQNTATLDEDIYLYRLDKNVELYFTIVNNKYKFDKSDLNNIINVTNASYFQMRLYKNAEVKYTFAIQPTDRGQAILTITDDLIDEPIEVGDYDFQISLLDADKSSMVSMPIAKQQLHVCEPLVTDASETGTAVLGLSTLETTGEIVDAFDEKGNYIRKVHVNGELISAELFNKWETALETNTTNINQVKENQITLIEDDTSMEGISDIEHDTLNTKDKRIIGAINEVNSQCKDIAKKTIVEGNKIYLAKNDGTKLDGGTNLPTSSGEKGDPGTSVTISSIVESAEDGGNNVVTFSDGTVLNVKNGNKGNDGTSGSGENVIETYKTEYIGELFNKPTGCAYLAWPAGNLKYDKAIDKYVCIINGADEHIFTTLKHYICFINPTTFEVSELKELTITDVTFDAKAICNFTILDNGNYMIIAYINNVNHKIISTDNGSTWNDNGAVTGNTSNHFWAIYKLSDGRLIGSIDVANKGLWYSDDAGASWTNVRPSGTPGNYNAEGCILELGNNKLMCIARKNMSGSGASSSGNADKAIISYSTNNGTTWSAWQESTSISMNASCCTGIVHDGLVEIFANNRWYHRGGYACTEYTNTGKNGALRHYVATIENSLLDNFTDNGVIVYANTPSDNSDTAQDFHSPCLATKGEDMLLVYFDRVYPYTADVTNYYFIRGNLKQLSYKPNDNIVSNYFSYSSKQIEKMLSKRDVTIANLQLALSKIKGSGVDAPTGTEVFTYEHNFNETQTLMGEDSPFYGSVYTKNTTFSAGAGYHFEIANSTVGDTRKIFKQQKNSMVIQPTKNNFVIEIKLSTKGASGVGIFAYDGGNYYGIFSMGANKFTNGGEFASSKDNFLNIVHIIKLKKQNGKYSLVIDDVDYDCPAMNKLDDSSIIETRSTQTWNHYIESSKSSDGATFTLDASKVNLVLASTSLGGNTYNEIDYIKYGEWD